jgi:hypothetical protein
MKKETTDQIFYVIDFYRHDEPNYFTTKEVTIPKEMHGSQHPFEVIKGTFIQPKIKNFMIFEGFSLVISNKYPTCIYGKKQDFLEVKDFQEALEKHKKVKEKSKLECDIFFCKNQIKYYEKEIKSNTKNIIKYKKMLEKLLKNEN